MTLVSATELAIGYRGRAVLDGGADVLPSSTAGWSVTLGVRGIVVP